MPSQTIRTRLKFLDLKVFWSTQDLRVVTLFKITLLRVPGKLVQKTNLVYLVFLYDLKRKEKRWL